jgi:hypothetical protein
VFALLCLYVDSTKFALESQYDACNTDSTLLFSVRNLQEPFPPVLFFPLLPRAGYCASLIGFEHIYILFLFKIIPHFVNYLF